MAKIGDAGRLRCSGCGALVGPPIELRLETVSTAEVFLYVPVRVSVDGSWEGAATRAMRDHVEGSPGCKGKAVSIEPPLGPDDQAPTS